MRKASRPKPGMRTGLRENDATEKTFGAVCAVYSRALRTGQLRRTPAAERMTWRPYAHANFKSTLGSGRLDDENDRNAQIYRLRGYAATAGNHSVGQDIKRLNN